MVMGVVQVRELQRASLYELVAGEAYVAHNELYSTHRPFARWDSITA